MKINKFSRETYSCIYTFDIYTYSIIQMVWEKNTDDTISK